MVFDCSIGVSSAWIQSCMLIYGARIYQQSCMLFHVRHVDAYEYNSPSAVLTFSACTPPLSQVLYLWDFLLAFGVHLNILCVIAQLLLIRDKILSHPSPMRLLRTFPPLQASAVIALSVSLVRQLPEHLYDLVARHPWDARVGTILAELEEGNTVMAV